MIFIAPVGFPKIALPAIPDNRTFYMARNGKEDLPLFCRK